MEGHKNGNSCTSQLGKCYSAHSCLLTQKVITWNDVPRDVTYGDHNCGLTRGKQAGISEHRSGSNGELLKVILPIKSQTADKSWMWSQRPIGSGGQTEVNTWGLHQRNSLDAPKDPHVVVCIEIQWMHEAAAPSRRHSPTLCTLPTVEISTYF